MCSSNHADDRSDLKAALKAHDQLADLHDEARDSAHLASATLESRRKDEAHRLLQNTLAGGKPTLTDVLPGYEALIEQKRIPDDRLRAARDAHARAWQHANSVVFSTHATELLHAVAAHRAGLPWSRALQPHIYEVYNRISSRFTFQLPMVAKSLRFHQLRLKPATPAMVRTWDAIAADELTVVDERLGMTTYRITAYWPELTEEPAIV